MFLYSTNMGVPPSSGINIPLNKKITTLQISYSKYFKYLYNEFHLTENAEIIVDDDYRLKFAFLKLKV